MVIRRIAWAVIALSATGMAANGIRLPATVGFERNVGQADSSVQFIARSVGYAVLITQDGAIFRSRQGDIRMRLAGANPNVRLVGVDRQSTAVNYFLGESSAGWTDGVPVFSRVEARGVYPGVDLIYTSDHGFLEYTFEVAPGAGANFPQIEFEGDQGLELDARGDLLVKSPGGFFRHAAPATTQKQRGRKIDVVSRYVQLGEHRAGFQIENLDRTLPVIIDPTVTYSTYLGGSGSDDSTAIAVDAAGNVYLAGWTESVDFPQTPGAKLGRPGGVDAFVAKLSSAGTLSYIAYLGGSGDDRAYGIAVDGSGAAIVAGWTYSTNFPLANAAQSKMAGVRDGFVAKLTPAGNALAFSTYIGGTAADGSNAVAADGYGNIYVAGETASANFPVVNAVQSFFAGVQDAFIAKFSSSGSLLYSTFLGGGGLDRATGIAVDASASAYITGSTSSADFPLTSAFQSKSGGGQDAFAAKIAPGGALVYSTYIGGNGSDTAAAIAVDGSGCAYITGTTTSINFPTVNPLQSTLDRLQNAFALKLNSSGSALVYSTYLGGQGMDIGNAVAIDASGSAVLAGYTSSPDFPIVNGVQPVFGGGYDAFAAKLAPGGSSLLWSTFIGGTDSDAAYAVAVDTSGNTYVSGETQSLDFPVNFALQPAKPTVISAFVLKLSAAAGPDFNVAATPSQTVSAGANAVYTLTTSALNGFSGAVAFSVSGLPGGASGSFTPSSVTGSGSTMLTVTTNATTAAGTYPLTITATDSTLVHTAAVSLTITAPAGITVLPAAITLTAGQTQQFNATVTGLSGNVNWSVNPSIGTISALGLYTPPPSVTGMQNVTVLATSQVNPAVHGTSTVTLISSTPVDLVLSNTALSSGAVRFQATNCITANTSFTVSGEATVTFAAGNYIVLGPGFTATAGSQSPTFTAMIDPGIH